LLFQSIAVFLVRDGSIAQGGTAGIKFGKIILTYADRDLRLGPEALVETA
jgi:hypothetical protein